MPRSFNGTSDKIQTSLGGLSGITFGTICAIVKVSTLQWNSVAEVANSTPVDVFSLEFSDTGAFYCNIDGSASFVAGGPSVADGWCFVAVTKPTGSNVATFWKYVFATDTWTNPTGSGSLANSGRTANRGYIGTYEGGSDMFAGEIAGAAVWNNVTLTDAQIRSLVGSWAAWLSASALWVLDQAATTTKVIDWVGGAAEATLTGTTVGTSSPPIGYGARPMTPTAVSGAAGGTATPSAVALTVSTPAATASGGAVATPAAVALTATTPAASAKGSSSTSPAAVALTVSTPAPTVTGGANTAPAAVARTVSTPAPTASGGSVTTPAAVALAVTAPAPTVTGGSNTSPAAVALTATTPAPTVTGGANTSPAAVALTVVTPAPTASGGGGGDGTAVPAAVALSVSSPTATVSGGSSTTPAAVALTVLTSAPTASGGAVALPAAVTRTVSVPAPTGSGGATTSPSTVLCTVLVPTPTTTGGAVATPQTVSLLVVCPAVSGGLTVDANPELLTLRSIEPVGIRRGTDRFTIVSAETLRARRR